MLGRLSLSDHEIYLQEAIEMAKQNANAPFGAVLVDQRTGEVVARGHNQSMRNPTLHGEIVAINNYSSQGGTDWERLTLYSTAEPCCMCQGAILWANIPEVVYGTSIEQLKQLGWRQIDIPAPEVISRSWNPKVSILGGILGDQCDQLFQEALQR